MRIIEKVYAKKNNRAYRFLRESQFFEAARLKHKQRHQRSAEMGSYAKIMGRIKLLKTRIQLKMNIKKNLLQKLKFYKFQIGKNKSLRNFRLKSLHAPGTDFLRDKEHAPRDTIKLPFVALELIDGQPVEIRSNCEKSKRPLTRRGNPPQQAHPNQSRSQFSETRRCLQEGVPPSPQSRLHPREFQFFEQFWQKQFKKWVRRRLEGKLRSAPSRHQKRVSSQSRF